MRKKRNEVSSLSAYLLRTTYLKEGWFRLLYRLIPGSHPSFVSICAFSQVTTIQTVACVMVVKLAELSKRNIYDVLVTLDDRSLFSSVNLVLPEMDSCVRSMQIWMDFQIRH